MMNFDRGPLQTYEIIWTSGYVEQIQAHQVIWPQQDTPLAGMFGPVAVDQKIREPRILIHGEIDGHWLLVLSAREADIVSIRLLTADESFQP